MPNVTSVWDFSPGETLTAAKLDDVNCGIHVFSGTATRDAAYGGSGERTLAEGEFAYLADSNTTQYYDGSSWQSVAPVQAQGLTLIKTQTIGTAVSSVEVTGAFSSTYENYRVVVNGVDYSSGGQTSKMTFGATATGYYGTWAYDNANGSGAGVLRSNGATFFYVCQSDDTDGGCFSMDIMSPNLAKRTVATGSGHGGVTYFYFSGMLDNTTAYTSFTLTTGGGTMTGGTIRVYGYQNS